MRRKNSIEEDSLYVYSAVPPDSNRLLRKYGLLSGVEAIKHSEVLKAARPSAKDRRGFVKKVKEIASSDRPYSVMGPSVLFTLPDPEKITDKHFIKQWNLQTIRIDLSRLIEDYPETVVWGAELLPYDYAWRKMSDEEFEEEIADLGFSSWEEYADERSRPLTLEEVYDFTQADPVDLWEHYHKSDIGKKYASNVPHAFIITPMGYIPYDYIEYVDEEDTMPSKLRQNPMITIPEFSFMLENVLTPDWEAFEYAKEFYPQSLGDPDKFLEEHPSKIYQILHGRDFTFVGEAGHMLRVYPEDIQPVEGNIFDFDKLKGLVVAPDFVDFKIPLSVGYVDPWVMDRKMYEEAIEYGDEFYSPDEDDIGEVFLQLRDGNHRTIATLLSGEPYAYAHISNWAYQDYTDWVKAGRPQDGSTRNLKILEYLDENLI